MSFGPDVTERFLAANGLQMLIRSHEVMEVSVGRGRARACVCAFVSADPHPHACHHS